MSTNSKLKGIVSCTKSQFEALTVKNGDKIYMIIDDNNGGGSSAEPLYRHSLGLSGPGGLYGYTTIVSKRAEAITSLDDIKAVLGNTFTYSCGWYVEDDTLHGFCMNENVLLSTLETTTKPWSSITAIRDQITEV